MHVAIPSIGLLGTNGIVGGGIPIAIGAAYGMQAQGRDDVTVCFFGEGAAATGLFGEALNLAALWRLPLIFVCENNQYVELTPQSVHVAGDDPRAAASRTASPASKVDGNDVDAVADAVGDAVARARGGGGPTLDRGAHVPLVRPLRRRPRGLPARRRGRPSGARRTRSSRARASIGDEAADALDAEVEQEIAEALAFAQQSPSTGEDVAGTSTTTQRHDDDS